MTVRVALATRNEDKPEPYRRALLEAGLEPVIFAPDTGQSLDSVQGLLLSGGVDVDPALYGESPVPETEEPDRERDDYESALLRSSLARDLPVLAICRGQQLFNVVCGGTLIQHLGKPRHEQKTGGAPVHDVVLEGRMAEVFGTSRAPVNSRHHQAAGRIGDGLIVTARDPEDGVIEGIVFPAGRFAMGVQWHPENMVEDQTQLRLFRAFASAMM